MWRWTVSNNCNSTTIQHYWICSQARWYEIKAAIWQISIVAGETRERAFRESEEIIAAGEFYGEWNETAKRKKETGASKLKNKEHQAKLKQWKWYRSSIPPGEISRVVRYANIPVACANAMRLNAAYKRAVIKSSRPLILAADVFILK